MTPHAWFGIVVGLLGAFAVGCSRDSTESAVEGSNTSRTADSENEGVWRGLERHEIQLDQKLLVVRGAKGVIGCPYLDVSMFEKLGDACAIIPAADTAGMLDSKVTAVTTRAKALGIEVGMLGRVALDKIR